MRFLLDASMPRCAVGVVTAHGGEAMFLRDMGLAAIPDSEVAALAEQREATLVTRDFDFADIRNYPPADFRAGIIVINLPDDATALEICAQLGVFLDRPGIETEMEHRLAIVRPGRVRFRPALSE
jgi:hypothetical protein